uniref:Uncharacterized protein n=1 Tax=Candidatus Kentrum sp. LFY TaxID=2126342 RepID=A0A450X239_9GAMM|nr:MAG: hypothetical protein BECKLFY1418C_GA0070996_11406 [Candidatus Kentron sp. LFY]
MMMSVDLDLTSFMLGAENRKNRELTCLFEEQQDEVNAKSHGFIHPTIRNLDRSKHISPLPGKSSTKRSKNSE